MRLKGVNSESLGQTQRMVLKQRILHKINDKELGVTGNYEGQPIDSGTMEITDLQQIAYTLEEAIQTFEDGEESAKFKIEWP